MNLPPRGCGLLPLIAFSLFCFTTKAEQLPASFEVEIKKTVGLSYLLSLPEGYEEEKDKEWPLVVFLHGAGERGDDIKKVKIHGPPKKVESGKNFPFILVSPQCPSILPQFQTRVVLEVVGSTSLPPLPVSFAQEPGAHGSVDRGIPRER